MQKNYITVENFEMPLIFLQEKEQCYSKTT